MANIYTSQRPYNGPEDPSNLNFYPSTYSVGSGPGPGGVSGQTTPFQAYAGREAPPNYASYGGFPAPQGVSGTMGSGQESLTPGWLAALGTEGYPGEQPLLEELGVNFDHIKFKTLAVLNPFKRIDQNLMDDADLAGPILFAALFGFFLRASGNVHFGYIYGLSAFGTISLHFLLSLMSPPPDPAAAPQHHPNGGPGGVGQGGSSNLHSSLTYLRSSSVIGYCLLPLVLTSGFGVVMPLDSTFGYVATILAILWCTYSSSAMFCAVGRMQQMRGLVAYPLALFYVCFGIVSIFSSRGAGSAERVR